MYLSNMNKRYVIEASLLIEAFFYHRDDLNKFMESIGATKGTMTLTTNLYKPFTRLDKYPSLLKELERHIEVSRYFSLNIISSLQYY